MTYEQGVRIASRGIVVYLICWAVSDAVGVPREIMALQHELQSANLIRDGRLDANLGRSVIYNLRTSVMWLSASVLRIALWLMAASWFYGCGPRIQRFFGKFVGGAAGTAENSAGDV